MAWSFDLVVARLEEASQGLRHMPAHDARFLAKFRAAWPDVRPEIWTEYGAVCASYRPSKPTGEQITRLDQVLDFLVALNDFATAAPPSLRIPPDIGRILWARASGWSWQKIQQSRAGRYHTGGNSIPSLRKVWKAGVRAILGHCLRHDIEPIAPLR